jgi:hypothetical protein
MGRWPWVSMLVHHLTRSALALSPKRSRASRLLNGFIAERAYELGEIDASLPFPEPRRLSYIDYRARDADDDPTFSSLIRKGLPGTP